MLSQSILSLFLFGFVQVAFLEEDEPIWSCGGSVEFENYEGAMWRDFSKGYNFSPYIIQIRNKDGGASAHVSWTIDPRPKGPGNDKRNNHLRLAKDADVFNDGPDEVSIDIGWNTAAVGPIWAYYWGNGEYIGAEMIQSKRQTKQSTKGGIHKGWLFNLGDRSLLKRLSSSKSWSVVVSDNNRKVLSSISFEIPDRDQVEAEYHRMRPMIERAENIFRQNSKKSTYEAVTCGYHEDAI